MAIEVFEQTATGVLREAGESLKRLVGRKPSKPQLSEREVIERETDLGAAKAKFAALRSERETLVKRIRERDRANKDPKESNADATRANEIEGVLLKALWARIGVLEREIAHDARAAAYGQELESNPVLKALVEAKTKHEDLARAEARLWLRMTIGETDADGKQAAPPPPPGSDDRMLLEIEYADQKKRKLQASLEVKAAVEARRKQIAEDKANKGALALKEWRVVADDIASAADALLQEHARLERLMPRLYSGGQNVPVIPRGAIEALKLYVKNTEHALTLDAQRPDPAKAQKVARK